MIKKVILFILMINFVFAYNVHNCASCHGYHPSNLDKFTAKEIKTILLDYKTGKRISSTMSRIAKVLSDKDIDKAAKMFGKK